MLETIQLTINNTINYKKTDEEYRDQEYSDKEYSDEKYYDEEDVSNLIQNELETEWFNEENNFRKYYEEFLDYSYIFNYNLPIEMINRLVSFQIRLTVF